jgi:hypothetical protein
MPNEESLAQLGKPTVTIRSPAFRDVYANNMKLAITPLDITIVLSHTSESPPGTSVIEEDVAIRVSPQFCKAFSVNLARTIATWEAQFGEIVLTSKSPEEVLAAVRLIIADQKV